MQFLTNFIRRVQYRRSVIKELYKILYLYPGDEGYHSIFKERAYAPYKQAIDDAHAEGRNPSEFAVHLAAVILNQTIAKATPETFQLMYEQTKGLDFTQFRREDFDKIISREKKIPDNMTFGTLFIASAIIVVRDMCSSEKIHRHDLEIFESEILGFLSGLSVDERARDRMTKVLKENGISS